MMRDLLDAVLFWFLAMSESRVTLGLAISFFVFACFSLLNLPAMQREGFVCAIASARRVAGAGIGLAAIFLVTVLLMAAGIDKKYYFLMFEFFNAAWLPAALFGACFFMFARTLAAPSTCAASTCGADENIRPPKA